MVNVRWEWRQKLRSTNVWWSMEQSTLGQNKAFETLGVSKQMSVAECASRLSSVEPANE